MNTTETRALAYRRVSSMAQAEAGNGLAAQLDACGCYAKREGLALAGDFADEGVSGAAPLDKRPALLAAIAELHKGDVLVISKRDRIARDVLNAAMIERLVERKGARIASADDIGNGADPASEAMRGMLAVFAQFERALIRERTRSALRAKADRGERVSGKIPYGFALAGDGVHLVEHEAEQQTIAEARRLRASGLTLRAVATELERRGLMSRAGRAFGPRQIAAMVSA